MPAVKTKKAGKKAKKSATKAAKAKKATLDDVDAVWTAMREIQELHKELENAHKETEKTLKDLGTSEQALKKSQEEAWNAIKEAQRNIFGVSNTPGLPVEQVMTPALLRKLQESGFAFDRITTVRWAVEGNIYAQIDGLLENGNQAMVVEVKTTLRQEDIDEHLERMEKVRRYADEHGDRRQFLGAIAATITGGSAKQYALEKGFFVIELSGEDVKVTEPVSEPGIW